ncbi:MAG: ATPase [Neomegalonema sp.]|nr:ATPase [Neomegalonema sp.]
MSHRYAPLPSPESFAASAHKCVTVFGMSGVGKTRLASTLRASRQWFHYSVDYRIGTRYMGEHISDNLKREAMQVPLLRELLLTDSAYIGSNITFSNLKPLATYLGKPGATDKGGIPFAEYQLRQEQHREAEINALLDTPRFFARSMELYGYANFLGDTGGSIVEVVDPEDPTDPVLRCLTDIGILVYIQEEEEDAQELMRRFDADPKPMYYREDFLNELWSRYLDSFTVHPDDVDPDAFIRWGFAALLAHRRPLYRLMAQRWGITVTRAEVESVEDERGFTDLLAKALERTASASSQTAMDAHRFNG